MHKELPREGKHTTTHSFRGLDCSVEDLAKQYSKKKRFFHLCENNSFTPMLRQIISSCDLVCQKKHSQDTALKLLKHYVLIEGKSNYLKFVSSVLHYIKRSFVSTQIHNVNNLLLNI